ncbi:MAG: 4a-hydroxytetrahydrobiopterin dehydratase [Chloroflexi bacterium]|nr:MAG: 4a-hydroxytetrahydrobiopterin dehydratase [Chloroflexota bacterium]
MVGRIVNAKVAKAGRRYTPVAPEAAAAALKDHPAWVVERSRIYRDFRLPDFKAAIRFVNEVAELAEEAGHHPNIHLHEWCFVQLELYSHAAGGLSRYDVDFALALDQRLGSASRK